MGQKSHLDLKLSPSGIELLNKCDAGFLYAYAKNTPVPRIRYEETVETTRFGSSFHTAAEHNFSEQIVEELEHAGKIDEEESSQIRTMASFIEKTGILNDVIRTEREIDLEYSLNESWKIRGILDYIGETSDGSILIVDWKTSSFPSYNRDYRQILTYGLIVWRLRDVKPEAIRLVVIYPRAETYREYQCTEEILKVHERYVTSAFRHAEKILKEYEKNPDMRRFTHTIGDCSFCVMKGRCSAYRIISIPEDGNDAEMTTDDLLDEYFSKRELAKALKLRLNVLATALMARLDEDSPYSTEEERQQIREVMSVVRRTTSVVSIDEYVDRLVVPRIAKMLRSDPLVAVDTDLSGIGNVLKEEIKGVVGKSVIDAKRLGDRSKSLKIEVREGKPYLRGGDL